MTRVGTVLSLPGAALAELAGSALDFAWIDLEHGALSLHDVQDLAIGLAATGCSAHVRLSRWDSELLPAVLDAGVDGVVAPRVDDAAAAAALVRRLRYPRVGVRGFGPRRAGDYGRSRAWWAAPEGVVHCTVQIESAAGVDAAEAIARVDGVDALVVGCSDLSMELGAPQDLGDGRLHDALARVHGAAAAAGKAFGVAAGGTSGQAASLAAGRADLLVYSVDARLYSGAIDAAAAELARALEGDRAAA